MKEKFIATELLPGDTFWTALIFSLESDTAKSKGELIELARKAARKYSLTDAGAAAYTENSENFNWGDLMDEMTKPEFLGICEELGIKIEFIDSLTEESRVDMDEPLMSDIPIIADVEWDTDEEDAADLPGRVSIELESPLTDVADALSDRYGFCVKNLRIRVL